MENYSRTHLVILLYTWCALIIHHHVEQFLVLKTSQLGAKHYNSHHIKQRKLSKALSKQFKDLGHFVLNMHSKAQINIKKEIRVKYWILGYKVDA